MLTRIVGRASYVNTFQHHIGKAIKADIHLHVDELSTRSTTAHTFSLPGHSPFVVPRNSPLSAYPRVGLAITDPFLKLHATDPSASRKHQQ
jgi:hypothetical protein